jgi:outer membrane protein OmpA-like peptidoglycan-associated protein
LLGDKMGGIVSMISKLSGLKSGSSSSLMKMAAPFLMGIIGKQVKGKGLGFLTDMLMGQKEHVAAALPSGMDNLLGLNFANMGDSLKGAAASVTGAAGSAISGVSNTANKAAGKATGAIAAGANATRGAVGNVAGAAGNVAGAAGDAAKSGLGWLKGAIPLLLLAGAAIWYFGFGNKATDMVSGAGDAIGNVANKTAGAVGEVAGAAGDAVGSVAGAATDLAKGAFATVNEAGKAALDKISFSANSAGSQMMEFIDGGFKGDGKVTFRNLTFASGSDKIDGTSGVEVDNLAAILKAYPDVKINVSGYTDSTGNADSNKTLSENRAKSVKQRLMDAGIAPSRIETAGFGSADPVASNDTKEGQAKNRRIEVTIAK